MRTKTLSLILAIAMLLGGCQTAPAQVSSAPAPAESEAPVVEKVESSSVAAEAKPSVEYAVSEKEEKQETENLTEPIVAQNGLKTYPAKYVEAEQKRKFDKVENMTPYMLDDQIVVVPDGSEVGYVLGKDTKDLKVFKEKNLLYHYGEDGMTFYDLETLEKTDFSLDIQCEDIKELEELKIQYDAALDQYAAVYLVHEYIVYDLCWTVEIQRFDSNGKFIDKYSTEVNVEMHDVEQVDIFNYNDGVIGYMACIDVGLSDDYYCVVCDFNTGKVISFNPEHKWEGKDRFIASRIDVSESTEGNEKTVKLTSVCSGKDFNNVIEYETVFNTDMDSGLLDFGYSSKFKYFDDSSGKSEDSKKRTIYTPWLKFEVDYASGECIAELDCAHTVQQLESYHGLLSSKDGRYKICILFESLDWNVYNDHYMVVYDKIEKRMIHIGWVGYDVTGRDFHIRNNNELLKFAGGISSTDLTDGSIRYIVSGETAKQHAKEKLGYLGAEIGAFDYDEKLDLLVLTMYDEPSEYSDYAYKPQGIDEEDYFNALILNDPNYFLAVYDINGNFIKHVLTDIPVYATGKHNSLVIEAIPVDNGIAWSDSEQAMPYMEDRPKYIVNRNRTYWRPVEKTTRNILCWRDFETETTGEMLIPNEWGEIVYVFDDSMIFRNIETGICYKCDIDGNLLDQFVCEDVIGMNKARWCPLPDFSGVIYNMDNYFFPKTYLWTRENGMIDVYIDRRYGKRHVAVRDNKVVISSDNLWLDREKTALIDLIGGKNVHIAADIAENYPDKFVADIGPYDSYLYSKEKQHQEMKIDRYLSSDVNTRWAYIRKVNGSNWEFLYCLNDTGLIQLPSNYIKHIKNSQFFVQDDMIGSFNVEDDAVVYRTLDLITNEQKSILTNLPTDYDDLRIVTVTDSGKVIIALQKDSQWKIFAQDAKI